METSKDRFIEALKGNKPDRPPLAYVAALTNIDLQQKTGCLMPDAHLDPEKLYRLCAAAHDVLRFDAVTFLINAFYEPAALGNIMDWGGLDQYPSCRSTPWMNPEDVTIPSDLLTLAPIRTYLDSIRIAKQNLGDKIAVVGKVIGPFTLTQVMHGVERTAFDLYDHPEQLKKFLEYAVQIAAICANAQFEAGADAISIGEGGAGANMLSPQMYSDILLEFHIRLVAEIKGPTIMHICGDITPRLDSLRKIGFTCFNFDWAIQPRIMREKARSDFSLMGNINTADLHIGKPEDIKRQVSENLDAGIDIISPGCAVSPLCPTENLMSLASGIDKWCQKNKC